MFGLITIKAWGYWCGYTAAQVQLIIADSPMIVYTHGKAPKPTAKAIDEKRKEWENREHKNQEISLTELLNNKYDEIR